MLDDAAAEADLAVIEDHGLPWSNGPLGSVEGHREGPSGAGADQAVLVGLAVADAGGESRRQRWALARNPVEVGSHQPVVEQPWVVATLGDHEHIALQVLVHHTPGGAAAPGDAADAEALTLPDGVVHQAAVPAQGLALDGLDVPRSGRQVALQEVLEAALADEADAGGVLLVVGGQSPALRQGPHLGLVQLADGKQTALQLLAGHRVEKIALVLVLIQSAQQARSEERRVGKEGGVVRASRPEK